ncbi:MAG: glycosyltransferase [Candidatus Levybacteria bacterium]|nr:glycosyltransferase [Candidatus Levybacteria bacterium]
MANSQEVRSRIQKFYRKDAEIIYPPVDIPSQLLTAKSQKQSYYLAGGRLARAKGIDIIIEAFNRSGKKLKIFGKEFAGFDEELKSIAGKNIEFMGEVTDIERQELMANAKAYVFASFDEDFGITPVEAIAAGTPVIAYRSGGVRETVVDGKTGIFFDENTPEAINAAIEQFEKTKISLAACRKQAQKFSSEVFDKKIVELVRSKIK